MRSFGASAKISRRSGSAGNLRQSAATRRSRSRLKSCVIAAATRTCWTRFAGNSAFRACWTTYRSLNRCCFERYGKNPARQSRNQKGTHRGDAENSEFSVGAVYDRPTISWGATSWPVIDRPYSRNALPGVRLSPPKCATKKVEGAEKNLPHNRPSHIRQVREQSGPPSMLLPLAKEG